MGTTGRARSQVRSITPGIHCTPEPSSSWGLGSKPYDLEGSSLQRIVQRRGLTDHSRTGVHCSQAH